ncbi:hypothetical protein AA0117_g8992 [Alternaria alternata]|uniref:NACHT domain-containing protein n=1 Tax=Alternaria alternata TaxID=5599 RepID=A0A4Q4N7P8_ALTAL|nr:hypothetical protein AA0117_g8992 [Alternaria alternata]
MEALIAVGLAGNVVQFLQGAGTLIAEANAIRKSGSPSSLPDLQRLSTRLTDQAAALAKTAIKFHWYSHRIDDFVAKLEKLRGSLTLATVLAFRTSSESSNDEILGHLREIRQDHKARNLDLEDIEKAINIVDRGVHLQTSDRLDAIQDEIQSCLAEINELRSEVPLEERSRSRESEILRWLDFRQVFWRYESITKAYGQTYEWIHKSTTKHKNWSNFSLHLLEDRSEPYFINGKAGSGKSTLMKFIFDSPETDTALEEWAGASELVKLQFFFWDLGTALQKSQVGMLRALLHAVLDQHPELVPAVFPRLYRSWKASDADIEPQYIEMKEAFEMLIEKSRFLRLAVFIDGIDEFEGNHRDMALLLRSLASPNVKLIVSSRPLNACLDAFAGCPTLRLQELTRADMKTFVQGELSSKPSMACLMQRYPIRAPQLTIELLDKAEGVFLWVKLVVRLLADGLEDGDNLEELHARLMLLPSDLRDLYKNMFGKMRIGYQKQAAVIFRLLDQWRRCIRSQSLPGLVLSYAICPPADVFEAPITRMTNEIFDWIMSTLDKRVRSRCCGLIELRFNEHTAAGWSVATNSGQAITVDDVNRTVVTYLHRTVSEFIAAPEVWKEICQLTNDMALEPTSSLASACLSTMKLANHSDRDMLKWYLEAAAGFCRKSTITDPQVIQRYVYEMDRIMSELHENSLSFPDHRSHDSSLHWSVTSHSLKLDVIDPAVEKHASIHSFAAGRGLLPHLRLLPPDTDHEERFVIVLYALSMWKDQLSCTDHTKVSLEDASEALSYLLRNVSGPESVAFDTSLWRQALLLCTNMSTNPTSTWEAAQLLKIFLSTVSSPQSLWHESVKAWQSTSTNPTHVLKSFRSSTKAHPSYEGNALLHDLERLTGTKDSQSAKAEVNRKMAKKTRRKNKTKRRAISEAS